MQLVLKSSLRSLKCWVAIHRPAMAVLSGVFSSSYSTLQHSSSVSAIRSYTLEFDYEALTLSNLVANAHIGVRVDEV
jgi:hypothetical protein